MTHGRREVTYSVKTRDLAEAVRRVKVASVETMNTFDDHRRKVAAEKAAVVKAAVVKAAADGAADPFAPAAEAIAANDDEQPALAVVPKGAE